MNSKAKSADPSHPEHSASSRDPATIQHALEKVLASGPFRTTRQCQDLLRYVVVNSLAGQDQLLRERVIGAEVFGRTPDYDTGEDPVVRIRAAEVRKRLAQYYQGAAEVPAVRIHVPSGSYRATFEWTSEVESVTGHEEPVPAHPPPPSLSLPGEVTVQLPGPQVSSGGLHNTPPLLVPGPSRRRWGWAAAIAIVFVLASAVFWAVKERGTPERDFAGFWAPLVSTQKPVLICIGTNAVYRLSGDFMARYMQEHHMQDRGPEFYVDWAPGQKVDAHDLMRAWNSFVALGDVSAISQTVAVLTRQGKAYQERFPPDISFAELHDTPAVLIGGFNNQMALTLTRNLRFTLEKGSQVSDRLDKTRIWYTKPAGDSHDTEDYAIVSRLATSDTGGPLIAIAGIGQYGTQAAADFVASPNLISELVKTAPAGWGKKNLQAVLHIKVIDFRPVSTEVVATHYW